MSFQARPVRCFPCLYLLHSATVSHWGEELSPHSHYHILHPRPDYGRSEVGGEGGNRVYPGICKHPVYLMLDIEQSHVDRGLHTWTLSILFRIKTIIRTVQVQLLSLFYFIIVRCCWSIFWKLYFNTIYYLGYHNNQIKCPSVGSEDSIMIRCLLPHVSSTTSYRLSSKLFVLIFSLGCPLHTLLFYIREFDLY